MAHRRKSKPDEVPAPGEVPDNLYDYADLPARRVGRPIGDDVAAWTVTDDWPDEARD